MAYGTAKGATRKLVGSIATSLAGTGAQASLLHHFILKKTESTNQDRLGTNTHTLTEENLKSDTCFYQAFAAMPSLPAPF